MNELVIEIGNMYLLDEDIYELVSIEGNYFILNAIKIGEAYTNCEDKYITMKAVQFSRAELLKHE